MLWADLKAYVDSELLLEGSVVDENTLEGSCNEAMGFISEMVHPARKTWTVATGELVAVSGQPGDYTLPSTFLGPIEAVIYDDWPLTMVSERQYEKYYREDDSADAVYVVSGNTFRTNASDTSLLEIQAFEGIGSYDHDGAGTGGATDPTDVSDWDPWAASRLPGQYKAMPGDYALMMVKASADVPLEMQRVQKAKARWEEMLSSLAQHIYKARSEPYRW